MTMQQRNATISASGKSYRAVLATQNNTRVFNRQTGRVILEALVAGGCETADQCPLLADHQLSVASSIGSVRGIRADGDKIVGEIHFSDTFAGQEARSLVADGHLTSVSVGYSVTKSETLRPGESRWFGTSQFTAPPNESLRVITLWTLKEVSLVPVGADSSAVIQARSFTSGMPNMTSQPAAALLSSHDGFPVLARAVLSKHGRRVPENHQDLVREWIRSGITGVDSASETLGSMIVEGFREAQDSWSGWTKVVELPNFKVSEIGKVESFDRLSSHPRGGIAENLSFGVSSSGWRMARYSAKLEIEETDLSDGGPISIWRLALNEVGSSARRVVGDLLFSAILENATQGDGVTIFAPERGNTSGAALSEESLESAIESLANHVDMDQQGRPTIHRNPRPGFLVASPGAYGVAKRLIRAMQTGQDDIRIRSESRLSGSVIDPRDGSLLQGTAGSWLLAAGQPVCLGGLDGRVEPKIRVYQLGEGRWGLGVDVTIDVGVAVTHPEGLFLGSPEEATTTSTTTTTTEG